MQRDVRLRSGDDFRRVRRDGRSRANALVVIVAAPRPDGPDRPTRVGVVAGKRVGDAVVRNRAKRRVRELLRHRYGQLKAGWDIVVIVRATLVGADVVTLDGALWSLVRRLDLVVDASCAALPSA
ncbi:MAG: ribonuclease P protein component [Ardenticatenales bacterium]